MCLEKQRYPAPIAARLHVLVDGIRSITFRIVRDAPDSVFWYSSTSWKAGIKFLYRVDPETDCVFHVKPILDRNAWDRRHEQCLGEFCGGTRVRPPGFLNGRDSKQRTYRYLVSLAWMCIFPNLSAHETHGVGCVSVLSNSCF